uniref:NADP-dependent oxidoreductase domain-containing protein n=1 Tax=Falco tinnunculus TaxID=100819 RepID=A0A8C4XRF9_FALTI
MPPTAPRAEAWPGLTSPHLSPLLPPAPPRPSAAPARAPPASRRPRRRQRPPPRRAWRHWAAAGAAGSCSLPRRGARSLNMAAAVARGGGASGCPTVPLANGRCIPVLGLGTSHQGGYSHDAVVHALRKCGIRHIDTAKRYGCESLLQKAIEESDVKREDLWITTKLWHSDYGYENTKKACLESCERLGVEYLDLYLIHWPDTHVPGKSNREVRAETWGAMEELYEKGLCRSIGVSNFLISHLEQLKEDCVITPHVNQVEYHPFQRPQELVDYCRSRNIVFEGYCPLAKGEALAHPSITQLAKKYGRTPAQICIRWSIQNGIVTIPKSTKAERIQENCKVFDFTLAEDDVDVLNGMHDGRHVSWDPSLIV